MDWNFPINDGGEFHGIGDPGIDLFKSDSVKSLTREICQNSLDAGLDNEKPVEIQFRLFDMPTSKIPGYNRLIEYFKLAQKFCNEQNFEKAKTYFDNSIPILEGQSIPVLRISDFNTIGLPGATAAEKDYTSHWFRLVRSVGSSDKGDGAIGSFGSGKKAAFACSSLQTVFYSTYVDGEGPAYQGVTKLIGFLDDENHMHSDVGYYSEKNSLPILDEIHVDESFKRCDTGTDVYVFGFRFGDKNWEKELIASVLDGFFYAIKENHLIVEVGSTNINTSTIGNLIEEFKDEIDKHTYDYYTLMNSDKTTKRLYTCLEENDVEIQMTIEPNMHRRVAIIRYPGMKVFDKGNISSTISFAGICIIKGKKIGKLLGKLENIKHDKWELSRYDDDPIKQKEADRQQKAIFRYIRTLFDELKGQDTEGEIDPDIGDCLPDPFSEDQEQKEALSDDVLEISDSKVITVKKNNENDVKDETGEEAEPGENEGTGGGPYINPDGPGHHPIGPGPGPGPGPDPGPNPPFTLEEGNKTPLKSIRANIIYKEIDYKAGDYCMWITPQKDIVNGRIEIFMGAESDSYKADIKEASAQGKELETAGHMINGVNIKHGEEIEIMIKLDYSDICSLEVKVYGH